MTLLETFKSIGEELNVEIKLADVYQANLAVDTLTDEEYPVVFITPYIVKDNIDKGGLVHSSIAFEALVLDKLKTNTATIDYDPMIAELECIEPMRALARKFINKFNVSPIADRTAPDGLGIKEPQFQPAYGEFDANVFGVFMKTPLNFCEGLGTCSH